jgi:Fe-S oxidoreductase
VKLAAGISPHRQIPRFARQPFRRVFPSPDDPMNRSPDFPRARPILLWPDTFTCSFHPETARSAARVLAAAGFDVLLPPRRLCCGRPLYDHGMLDLAKKLLRKVLRTLRGEIRAGLPVVVLEPSCAAVFQDELPGLFPQDEDARLLSAQTVRFAEFLGREAAGWAPRGGRLGGTALLQGHCHQTALASLEPERALLSRLGLDVRVLDAGCCGMAGAFGFEADHYDVSVAIARDALLPALSAEPEALVVADGFSCREQIRQLAGRSALHVAEVVDRALARSRIGNRESGIGNR